jgi:hypothetical protein
MFSGKKAGTGIAASNARRSIVELSSFALDSYFNTDYWKIKRIENSSPGARLMKIKSKGSSLAEPAVTEIPR